MRARPLLASLLIASLLACSTPRDAEAPAVDAGFARDAEDEDAGGDRTDAGSGDADAADAAEGGADASEGGADASEGGADAAEDGGLDAGFELEPCVPIPDPVPTSTTPKVRLSETGLYADTSSKTLAPGVEPFQPRSVLWSDGATKQRYVRLPGCEPIDTRDMDSWVLPVGARLWKEFGVEGKRIETRLIERFGPGPGDFHFLAYAWNEEESDAVLVPRGVLDARGTNHDIPAQAACVACHRSAAVALGFSALQLSHAGPGVTMARLSTEGRVTHPAPSGFEIPGDAIAKEALGYLHANCGHCHNDESTGIPFRRPFVLRLSTLDLELEDTGALRTAVGVPSERFFRPGITARIARGAPDASCVVRRMSVRTALEQMPPLASEIVDPAGVASVRAWVEAL